VQPLFVYILDKFSPYFCLLYNVFNVGDNGDFWPMLLKNFLAEIIFLAEGSRPESRPFAGKAEASDATEEVDMRELLVISFSLLDLNIFPFKA